MSVIKEKVVKVQNKAEANRFFNYPYNALEELLVNAVFHKSYRDPEPVEIRIYVDSIQIINYPGPAKWINMEKFKEGKVRARKYRNRRIGEFLKEIDLSEKQSTGITKVINELNRNSSPLAEFETDDDRTYLITTLTTREGFETLRNLNENDESFDDSFDESLKKVLSEKEYMKMIPIIEFLKSNEKITPVEAEKILKKSRSTTTRYLNKMIKLGILVKEGSTNDIIYRKIT